MSPLISVIARRQSRRGNPELMNGLLHPQKARVRNDVLGRPPMNCINTAWQEALANTIKNPKELLEILQLDMNLLPAAEAASRLFPLNVPRGFVNRMQPGDPYDPLLRQILPI